jgi:hypothetical protein
MGGGVVDPTGVGVVALQVHRSISLVANPETAKPDWPTQGVGWGLHSRAGHGRLMHSCRSAA